jgi:hypothetical protein
MSRADSPVDLEDDVKFDADLLRRLAKIVEVLQDIED